MYKCGLRFCETNLREWIRKTSTIPILPWFLILPCRRNSENKIQIHWLGQVTYLYFSDYLELKGITLGIRLGHFRYGYSRLDAYERERVTAQILGKWAVKVPALLGERKFPLPVSDYSWLQEFCPRHPHTTFFNIMFILSLSLLDFCISRQSRRSSFSHWTP